MGLAGPRKRRKINNDPNNTTWARSTTNYGHQMLVSQGWAPGSLLGATNAPHAHLHSNASASHIRVTLREDKLGLGAKHGSGQGAGECTGLDNFQDLLGRLNGKSETQMGKEQESRNNLKRTLYTESRLGTLHFVSGGLLVGEKITELVEAEKLRVAAISSEERLPSVSLLEEEAKPKKRGKKSKAHLQMDNAKSKSVEEHRFSVDLATNADSLSSAPIVATEGLNDRADVTMDKKVAKLARKAKKEEKLQRKLDRRKRKEEKMVLASVELEELTGESRIHSDITASIPPVLHLDAQSSNRSTEVSTPSGSGAATPTSIGSRHMVRQRYIMQKRRAVMDPKALNEILMIKA
ncbi:MAG: telomerase inhibitor [Icmadophila ericetorum]|nr:telomerase inhibitor [Icmadophila ericetorum]